MKSEKGITLMVLAITVIILLIITGVGVGASVGLKGNIKQSKNQILETELYQVQQAVLETYIKYKQTNNTKNLIGNKIEYSEASNYLQGIDTSLNLKATNYDDKETVEPDLCYYILEQADLEKLRLNNSDDVYVVNYSTGEVFNYTVKKTEEGKVLYICVD